MTADLYLHSMRGVSIRDLECFFSTTIGSKYYSTENYKTCKSADCIHYRSIAESSKIWIGEVSFLKDALFNDNDYIPSIVLKVYQIIDENLPVLDKSLKAEILAAIDIPTFGNIQYATTRVTDELLKFLDDNTDYQLFLVAW